MSNAKRDRNGGLPTTISGTGVTTQDGDGQPNGRGTGRGDSVELGSAIGGILRDHVLWPGFRRHMAASRIASPSPLAYPFPELLSDRRIGVMRVKLPIEFSYQIGL